MFVGYFSLIYLVIFIYNRKDRKKLYEIYSSILISFQQQRSLIMSRNCSKILNKISQYHTTALYFQVITSLNKDNKIKIKISE